MYFFGALSIIISLLFGGSAAYMFISNREIDYFTLNGNINVGIFFAILGIGFFVINKLHEIKKEISETKQEIPHNRYLEQLTREIKKELEKLNNQETKKKTVEKITKELNIEPEKPAKSFDVSPLTKEESEKPVHRIPDHGETIEEKNKSFLSGALKAVMIVVIIIVIVAFINAIAF